jgi:hypothetical protein
MSPEQGTGVATPVVVAEPTKAAVQHEAKEPATCANCGAAVPGRFCGRCGQRLEHEIHSVLHFTREATEDLTHADSRLWKTIYALLLKPGFLTREFLDGRRVRYLPPLRLYLVLSVLFFLAIDSGHRELKVVTVDTDRSTPSVAIIRPDDVAGIAARPGETLQQREARVCQPDYDGPAREFVVPFLKKGCRNMIEDHGRTVAEAFMHNLPRGMFIFLPVLALVMKAMYWRPRRHYVEHLLFFVHNHAFAFLLLGLVALLTRAAPQSVADGVAFMAWLYIVYYFFVSMRQVYGQSRWRTFAKLTVLSFTYLIGIALTLALTGMYSVYSV